MQTFEKAQFEYTTEISLRAVLIALLFVAGRLNRNQSFRW